jgi:hypothetical protein
VEKLLSTGSEVKQDESDVILARELVKGTATIPSRDDKGHILDLRTAK